MFFSPERVDELCLLARHKLAKMANAIVCEVDYRGQSILKDDLIRYWEILLAVEYRKSYDNSEEEFQRLVLLLYSKLRLGSESITPNTKYILVSGVPSLDQQSLANLIQYIITVLLPQKADDSNVLHKTGDETKSSGVLTFIESPKVPIAEEDDDAVPLGQIQQIIDNVLENIDDYELPIATDSSLGGVIIGNNLDIDENGVLSVEFPDEYELPVATEDELGGVRAGENVTITEEGELNVEIDLQTSTDAGNRTDNDIILEQSKLIIEGIPPVEPYELFLSSLAYSGGIFRYSGGIVKDGNDNLYHASNQGLALISPNGLVATDIATWGNQTVGGVAYYNGYIYVSLNNINKIIRVNLTDYVVTDYITSGLNYPMGITFNAQGQLFVFDAMNRRVLRYESGGTIGTVVAGGNGFGSGMNQFGQYPANGAQIALHNGDLYIADHMNHRVLRWTVGSAQASQSYAVENAKTIAVAPNGDLYVGSYNGAGSTQNLHLVLFPVDGSPRQTLLSDNQNPRDYSAILLDSQGEPEYFAIYEGSSIWKSTSSGNVIIENTEGKVYSNGKRLLDTDDLFEQGDIDFTDVYEVIDSLVDDIASEDANTLHRTGDETVTSGVKIFNISPRVPDPTINEQAMNLRKARAMPLDPIFSRNIGVIARNEVVSVSASYSKDFIKITPSNNYTHIKLFVTDGNSNVRAYEVQAGYDSNRFFSWQQLTPYQEYRDRPGSYEIDIKAVDGFGPINFGLIFRLRAITASSISYRIEYHHMYPAVGTDYEDYTKLNGAQYLTTTQPVVQIYPYQNNKANSSELVAQVAQLQAQINLLLPLTGEMSPEFISNLPVIDDGDTSALVAFAPYRTTDGFIKYNTGAILNEFSSEFGSEMGG